MTGPDAGAVTVRLSSDPARLDALRAEWSALLDAAGVPSPFLSWEWLAPWRRHFAARRALRVLEARGRDGALAGLLLLSARPGLAGARRWQLLGNGVTGADGLDMLVGTYNFLTGIALNRYADQRGIDAFFNGLGDWTRRLGAGLRRVENGFVRSYALAVLVGVVAIVGYILFR